MCKLEEDFCDDVPDQPDLGPAASSSSITARTLDPNNNNVKAGADVHLELLKGVLYHLSKSLCIHEMDKVLNLKSLDCSALRRQIGPGEPEAEADNDPSEDESKGERRAAMYYDYGGTAADYYDEYMGGSSPRQGSSKSNQPRYLFPNRPGKKIIRILPYYMPMGRK